MVRRVHIDTDFAGDPDDACALVALLGAADADVVAITTSLEDDGGRHDCVRAILRMTDRGDIPSAAGFGRTLTNQHFECTWNDRRHWSEPPERTRCAPGAALDLLASSIDSDTTVLAIGGFTNLAALELARPGTLARARVVAMAGWIEEPALGWPQWDASMDFNTQCDTTAAMIVAEACAGLTLVTLPVAMRATLQIEHLDRLRAAGPVGELLARQSEAHRQTSGFGELARMHESLPNDLVNFHWDPVAAGVALGWDSITTRPANITAAGDTNGVVAFDAERHGDSAITTSIDARAFEEQWLRCIETLI